MNIKKIASFIKEKRKEKGLTQEELAQKLFVTEKAVSRWETGRGTPDISLLVPLSKELNVEVSEILNGEENKKNKNDVESLIIYNEITKKSKYNFNFKLIILLYVFSILTFLIYLRFEYAPNIEVNYFLRLLLVIIAASLVVIGNKTYVGSYVEKLEDKNKIYKFSLSIVFIYYVILLFNMAFFARYSNISSYNLIPFKSIGEIMAYGSTYSIIINIFGNLFVFMPIEYFLIELFNKKKFLINLLISFIVILAIELIQYIFKVGVFDIDDIILSLFGMMVFYICYNKLKMW